MLQLRHHPRFTLETASKGPILIKGRVQHLKGHKTVKRSMVSLINSRHAALAKLFYYAIWANAFAFSEGHTLTPSGNFLPL
jgi:hypothetical protein